MMGFRDLFRPVDMTEGAPAAKIVAFTIPMLIGNIAQQLYNTVDSIIVGRLWATTPSRPSAAQDRS